MIDLFTKNLGSMVAYMGVLNNQAHLPWDPSYKDPKIGLQAYRNRCIVGDAGSML